MIDSPEGRLEWIPDEKLTSLNLWPSDQVFFPWLEKDDFFSAKFIYQGDEMKSYEVKFIIPNISRQIRRRRVGPAASFCKYNCVNAHFS